MLKSLISSVLVVAVVFISILNVGAVNEPTAPTEYITEVVTDVATEVTTETYTELPTDVVTDVISDVHFYEVLCFIKLTLFAEVILSRSLFRHLNFIIFFTKQAQAYT